MKYPTTCHIIFCDTLTHYRPQTKFAKVMVLQMSVCPQMGRPGQVHPPGPGRCTHPPRTRQVHPTGPGRDTPWSRQVHLLWDQAGTPTPGPGVPPSSACWEIRATSERYASYWNAFLFSYVFNDTSHITFSHFLTHHFFSGVLFGRRWEPDGGSQELWEGILVDVSGRHHSWRHHNHCYHLFFRHRLELNRWWN